MLITEQVFLLLTTDKGSGEPWVGYRRFGLGAAILADLALHDVVAFTDEKRPRVNVTGELPPDAHPALVNAHQMIREKPNRRAQRWIGHSDFGRIDLSAANLVQQGVLEEHSRGFLFIQWAQYPTRDASIEQRLRARLQQVFHGQAQETIDEGVTLLIVDAVNGTRNVFKEEIRGLERKQVKGTIEEIRHSLTDPALNRIVESVALAIKGATAALIATVAAANASAANATVISN